ncbi:hypothetical protein B0J11DRAFT_109344 [Dendryphion nanum]|uniref:BHLH domain-containing protein n=1 Tax=Dendryphion nanum TaxID=256645 RepID=A0A9P9DDP4_9PLEO|nr:hypothetical protein B0J11DRAFT_109344 [Dendryphion nanum]
MDFSDYTSFPIVANPDFSPTMDSFSYPDETFGKAYHADSYTTSPDYTFDSFFDRPVSSIEQSRNFSQAQPAFNNTPTITEGSKWTNGVSTPYENFNTQQGFSFEPMTSNTFESSTYARTNSPTPSLCGDAPVPAFELQPQGTLATSPSLSPQSLKRESPSFSPPPSPPAKRAAPSVAAPPKKRGRPRLDRALSASTASSVTSSTTPCASKARPTHRLPHNQVERKYREGLNSELERLRRAVPTLPQTEDGTAMAMGQPKPSKAMVLAAAIDYIKRIERERDAALQEVERLRNDNAARVRWN